ncbi:rhomboid family intramembrane serine protease [Aquihabitans sp. McL0605]|uniref:rhomboid family intramembrane serine protease n=1 Tax=Aquihabitans sp. McL0605 TaxID=3415671 RepID=UPI003CEE2059
MALPLRDDERSRRVPWLTMALIAINVVVFLFIQPSGFQWGAPEGSAGQSQYWRAQERDEFTNRWGAIPCELRSGKALIDSPPGCKGDRTQYPPAGKSVALALLTCMFLHGSIDHLAGNMLFLWVFGSAVEDRLGRSNFLGLYLLGGIIATLGYVATNPHSAGPLIGASGAIAVVMGAYLVLAPRARILTVIATAAFQVVYVPAAVVLLLFFVTQFFTADENVAWEAHAAGMVVGAIAGLVLMRIPAIKKRSVDDAADARLRAGAEF